MSLINELEKSIGKNNVLSSKEDLYCYSYDAKALNEKDYLPDVVVTPETIKHVQQIMLLANKYSVPVVPRGSATNLSGGCLAVKGGIIIHMSKMNSIISIDKENLTCIVQAGVITETLQKEVEKIGLFYPPDPASLKVSSLGGNIAESASGPRCFKYGGTKDYVLGLKVVLADGIIVQTGGQTVKNVTGYNLTQLFVGSEGTLGIICEAILKLIPYPEYKKTMLAVYNSIDDSAKTVTEIIANKIVPTTLELLDKNTMQTIENYHPTGLPIESEASLLIEVDGFKESVQRQVEQIEQICRLNGAVNFKVAQTAEESEQLWFARRSALGAVSRLKPSVVVEDATVPRSKIPEMISAIRNIAKSHNVTVCLMGHVGDGNLHPNISFDVRDEDEVKRVEMTVKEIFDKALSLGGTLSGEHGIGTSKKKFLSKALTSDTIDFMKNLKATFDPKNLINPGKIW